MRTLGGPWTALADGMAGPHAGGLAVRPVVAPARHSLRKATERADANARQLTYMLLDGDPVDLTDCPGESHGGGLGGARCTRSCSGPVASGSSGA
jgi:hypothetical protein